MDAEHISLVKRITDQLTESEAKALLTINVAAMDLMTEFGLDEVLHVAVHTTLTLAPKELSSECVAAARRLREAREVEVKKLGESN